MRTRQILYLIFLFFTSCKYFKGDKCNNTLPIIGTYQNTYDKKAENLLIIKEDGTFEQIFKKGEIVRENNGTWKLSTTRECYVILKGLKVLHEIPLSLKKYFDHSGVHRFNNILFFEDTGYAFDFYRVE
tara:strand:- start:248 stop:634 length:387 start_codon:yes stop_codon:yes gene_type:complete